MRKFLELLLGWWCDVPSHPRRRQAGYAMLALAAVGAYEGIKSSNAAAGAANAENQDSLSQQQLAHQNEATSGDLYNDYNSFGLPVTAQYIKESETPVSPQSLADQAVGAINSQARSGAKATTMQDEAYGINPGSGRALAERSTMNLNTSIAKAGAATAARQQAINETLSRLGGGVAAGQGLLSGAESFAGEATSGFNGAGAMEGNVGNLYGDEAAGFGGLAGYGLGKYYGAQQPQTPDPNAPPSTPEPPPVIGPPQ